MESPDCFVSARLSESGGRRRRFSLTTFLQKAKMADLSLTDQQIIPSSTDKTSHTSTGGNVDKPTTLPLPVDKPESSNNPRLDVPENDTFIENSAGSIPDGCSVYRRDINDQIFVKLDKLSNGSLPVGLEIFRDVSPAPFVIPNSDVETAPNTETTGLPLELGKGECHQGSELLQEVDSLGADISSSSKSGTDLSVQTLHNEISTKAVNSSAAPKVEISSQWTCGQENQVLDYRHTVEMTPCDNQMHGHLMRAATKTMTTPPAESHLSTQNECEMPCVMTENAHIVNRTEILELHAMNSEITKAAANCMTPTSSTGPDQIGFSDLVADAPQQPSKENNTQISRITREMETLGEVGQCDATTQTSGIPVLLSGGTQCQPLTANNAAQSSPERPLISVVAEVDRHVTVDSETQTLVLCTPSTDQSEESQSQGNTTASSKYSPADDMYIRRTCDCGTNGWFHTSPPDDPRSDDALSIERLASGNGKRNVVHQSICSLFIPLDSQTEFTLDTQDIQKASTRTQDQREPNESTAQTSAARTEMVRQGSQWEIAPSEFRPIPRDFSQDSLEAQCHFGHPNTDTNVPFISKAIVDAQCTGTGNAVDGVQCASRTAPPELSDTQGSGNVEVSIEPHQTKHADEKSDDRNTPATWFISFSPPTWHPPEPANRRKLKCGKQNQPEPKNIHAVKLATLASENLTDPESVIDTMADLVSIYLSMTTSAVTSGADTLESTDRVQIRDEILNFLLKMKREYVCNRLPNDEMSCSPNDEMSCSPNGEMCCSPNDEMSCSPNGRRTIKNQGQSLDLESESSWVTVPTGEETGTIEKKLQQSLDDSRSDLEHEQNHSLSSSNLTDATFEIEHECQCGIRDADIVCARSARSEPFIRGCSAIDRGSPVSRRPSLPDCFTQTCDECHSLIIRQLSDLRSSDFKLSLAPVTNATWQTTIVHKERCPQIGINNDSAAYEDENGWSIPDVGVPIIDKDLVTWPIAKNRLVPFVIGKGTFGEVKLAVYMNHEGWCSNVAIKVFHDSSGILEIVREGKILQYLQDTGVFPKLHGCLDMGSDEKPKLCLVQELFGDGKTLHHLIDKEHRNPYLKGRGWMIICIQLAKGLRKIHAKNVIFNDLKDNNILVNADAVVGRPVIKFIDVGISTFLHGVVFDDPDEKLEAMQYLAPEVRGRAESTMLSDIYSLGKIYERIAVIANIPGLSGLAMACCKTEPNKRMSLDKLTGYLVSIARCRKLFQSQ